MITPERFSNKKIPDAPRKQKFLDFKGGLDLVTPSISAEPGMCRDSLNFEIDIIKGYKRSVGYERFDGQAKPSDATYGILNVTISGSFSVDDVITGGSSGATATVLAVVTTTTPAYLVISKISGTFENAEDLSVSAVVEGVAAATVALAGGSTPKLHAQYLNLAADLYRADIEAVPGSGKVRGVKQFNGVVYAWRDNALGTSCLVYKSTAAGWSQVSLGFELAFTSGGTYIPQEGDTIEGATSGATAVLTRVMLKSGSYAAGTAAGKLIFASQTGTFQAENLDIGANADVCTIAGDSSAITLLPGGRYEIIKQNFGGLAGTKRMYGADGVNRGFEFDGTVYCPIDTGMTVDTPTHVHAFKNHLFFSFEGSSQHSGIGTPYSFSLVFGAAELAIGDTITNYVKQPGSEGNAAMAIFSRNVIHILYGNSSADWNLVHYRDEVGAYAYTAQEFGMTMMLDDRGVADLATVQDFGNFKHNTVSRHIQPYLNERKTTVTAACISRDKSQYRLFFSDGAALYVTTSNRKVVGMMPMLFEHVIECIDSDEAPDGTEEIYFGDSDGFIHQMEKGTSFDGENVISYLHLHYFHAGSPRVNKNWKNVMFEVDGDGYSEFSFRYELGYNSADIAQSVAVTNEVSLIGNTWDSGLLWDSNVFWDGRNLTPTDNDLEGSGENISLIIAGDSDYQFPLRFSGALLQYTQRKQIRRGT